MVLLHEPVEWPSLTAAKKYFRSVLQEGQTGEKIRNKTVESDLRDLLNRHPDKAEKLSGGLDAFWIVDSGHYGQRCFALTHKDGTLTTFSYLKCLTKCPPKTSNFDLAARYAVQPYIFRKKRELLKTNGPICEITKRRLPERELQIDHIPPTDFATICDLFLRQEELEPQGIPYLSTGSFASQDLTISFRNFHTLMSEGNLRLICKSQNIGAGSQSRLARKKRAGAQQLLLQISGDTHG